MIYETIPVKLPNGKYKIIFSENIESILVKKNGETIICFNGGYGVKVEIKEEV